MNPNTGRSLLQAACRMAVQQDRAGRALRCAIQAADSGEVDRAISLASAAAAEPRCGDAEVFLGCLLEYERGNRPLAARHFAKAVTQDASNGLALWHLARDETRAGNAAVGLAMLHEAVAAELLDTYAAVSLAWHLSLLGAASEAASVLARLKGPQRLVCPTLETVLLAMASPLGLQGSTSGGDSSDPWCSDLLLLGAEDGGREALCEIALKRSGLSGCIAGDPAAASPCVHLDNPALRGYRDRYGERVVASYVRTFFREVLVPEVRERLLPVVTSRLRTGSQPKETPPDMVVVPRGRYVLGDPAKGTNVTRQAELPAFLIDRYPVTQKQWREFVPTHLVPPGQENHPVVGVDFLQAVLYARWKGKRLPTEAEWEAAASGPGGWPYPWGTTPDPSRANCAEAKLKHTSPVTQFPLGASRCGAMDMIGNAQEWVRADHCACPPGGQITKGGCFGIPIAGLTYRWRIAVPPLAKNPNVGFRCARDL